MKIYLIAFALMAFMSCNSQSSSVFNIGRLDSNTYSNKYFGMTLKIDTSWKIMNRKELTQLIEERKGMLEQTNNTKYRMENGANVLLSLTGDTLENIPQILFSSLDLSALPNIKNETIYLEAYAKQVQEVYKDYDLQILVSEIGKESINNRVFFTSLITIKAPGYVAYQKRYSLKFNNILLNIMANYKSSSMLSQCEKLLSNLNWD